MNYTRPQTGTAFKAMLQALAREGWSAAIQPPAPHGIVSTTMICPARYLALNLQANTIEGSVTSTISTLPDGTGAPAFWRAVTNAPPPCLWLQAARAATRAATGLDAPPNPFPAAALRHLGWSHAEQISEGRWIEHVFNESRNRSLLHRRPTRATPGSWSIVRADATITIEVSSPDTLALPALVLALALRTTDSSALAQLPRG